ncbi:LOW QUALITY PROTEIN: Hypothetical protein PHPALM_36585 [Phytophthora palmivora]|uniref:Uncharacterized protein n=1 Tax=Phytophthora palmivora TaxID=4796 RepID=A0A2P4WZK5_9STRA|nr:LOW QUALITY PROTEIN: Hypothetical protein PHPALM_36585 [Phytophthora palmivora]
MVQLDMRARLHASEREHPSIPVPTSLTCSPCVAAQPHIDTTLRDALSALVSKGTLTLEATVVLWRNETDDDPRPTKALDPLDILLHGYDHREQVVVVAARGVSHTFIDPRPSDSTLLMNHSRVRPFDRAVDRSISEGQANDTYLVLAPPLALAWDTDPSKARRLIHNLSYPRAQSINACLTQAEFPTSALRAFAALHGVSSSYPRLIARIDQAGATFRVDGIAGVLRHIWRGNLLSGLTREPPLAGPQGARHRPFFSYVWVDDHLLVETERENRLKLAKAALRLSMLATLGPDAINEVKFSTWSTKLVRQVVKALSRLREVIVAARATLHQLEKLLGSLCHISLCYRSARVFFHRLHVMWRRAPRFGSERVSTSVLQALQWFEALLHHDAVNGISTSLLVGTWEPCELLSMDASVSGLVVLYPAISEYFRVQFDSAETPSLRATTPFGINTRELLNAVFRRPGVGASVEAYAADIKHPIHVRCWIDNFSATAWIARHQAYHSAGQELLRVVLYSEVELGLHVSAEHIPLVDTGSRAWFGTGLCD